MVWLEQKSRLNLFRSDRKYLSTEHVQLAFKKRSLWENKENKTRNDLHSACVCLFEHYLGLMVRKSPKTDITYICIYYLQLVWEGFNQSINQSINHSIDTNTQFVKHYWNFQCAWVSEPLEINVGLSNAISWPICTYFTRWLIRINSFSKNRMNLYEIKLWEIKCTNI